METFTFTRVPWIRSKEAGQEIPDPVFFEAKKAFCKHRSICYLCGNVDAPALWNFFFGMHRCRNAKTCNERWETLAVQPITVKYEHGEFSVAARP